MTLINLRTRNLKPDMPIETQTNVRHLRQRKVKLSATEDWWETTKHRPQECEGARVLSDKKEMTRIKFRSKNRNR